MSDQGNIPYTREFIELQSEVLKALSHPTRIEIVYMLQEGPLCVCEIVDILKGEYSNISRHLTKLARAGVLSAEKKRYQHILCSVLSLHCQFSQLYQQYYYNR